MAMNVPNAFPQGDLTAEQRRAYEPSMEEILASIRRIITDDQVAASYLAPEIPVPPQPSVSSAPPSIGKDALAALAESDSDNISGWTDVPAAPPRAAPEPADPPLLRSAFDVASGHDFRSMPLRAQAAERPAFTREAAAAPRPMTQPVTEAPAEPPAPRRPIVPTPQASAPAATEEALVSPATDAMVAHAFNTLVASRFLQSNDAMSEMVREMLRPMLKAWLDDNLPILVERLVRAEIERVARGGH